MTYRRALVATWLAGAAACAQVEPAPPVTEGAISVHLSFAGAAAGVPAAVDRLQLVALDAAGSTLAETNLWARPMVGQLPIVRTAEAIRFDRVPPGTDRAVVGHA